jgi:hypothetical protein
VRRVDGQLETREGVDDPVRQDDLGRVRCEQGGDDGARLFLALGDIGFAIGTHSADARFPVVGLLEGLRGLGRKGPCGRRVEVDAGPRRREHLAHGRELLGVGQERVDHGYAGVSTVSASPAVRMR